MEQLQVGQATLTWLRGGVNHLDGGAMFGVVPKVLWSRRYPSDAKTNLIELRTDPILLQIDGKNFLIDTGIDNDKLTEKQIRNFGVLEQSFLEESLAKVDLTLEDIDAILMTHLHFDHACGLTRWDGEKYVPVFENIPIYTSAIEWHEMRYPNIRSVNTYWKMNWEAVQDQMQTFVESLTIVPGLRMIHTGGHSEGHSIIVFEDEQDCFIHLSDLMPTHGHHNKLWVLAYDDYPVTSVHEKEKWLNYGYEKEAWFTFYHDAYVRAMKVNKEGEVVEQLKRRRQ